VALLQKMSFKLRNYMGLQCFAPPSPQPPHAYLIKDLIVLRDKK